MSGLVKTASTVQRSAPVRISDLSARSPSKSCSAPIIIDFPAPVSPVTATNPGPICHASSSTSARFLIRNSVRNTGIRENLIVDEGRADTCEYHNEFARQPADSLAPALLLI